MKTKNNVNQEAGFHYCARVHLTFDEKVALYKKLSKSELARMLARRDEIDERAGMVIAASEAPVFTTTTMTSHSEGADE